MTGKSGWFGDLFDGIDEGLRDWSIRWNVGRGRRGWSRSRRQIFESGDLKYLILDLVRERPRHGYDIIKELEERMGGCYTPSPGTVYPTLQLLEDEGYIKSVETDGKRVYQITPEGEAFLATHRTTIDEIIARVRDTVRDLAGGPMRDIHVAVGRLTKLTYRWAFRRGPHDDVSRKMVEILRRAAVEIEALQQEHQ